MSLRHRISAAAATLVLSLSGWAQSQPTPTPPPPPATTATPATPPPTPPPTTPETPPAAKPAPASDPTTEPDRGATVAAEPEEQSACEGKWFTRVYQSAYKSVVRIDTGGGLGAGFLFHSPKHVATAFHVVSLGRSIEVTFSDQKTTSAEVVAVDTENDLAILELAEPAVGLQPLEPGNAKDVELGTPVVAIGHPYATVDDELEGLLSWSVSQGIISGRGERLLQTDAALNPGNSGGPLLDCDGKLLGVVSAKLQAEGIGFVIPSQLLVKLTGRIGTQPPFGGDWRFMASLGVLFHGTPQEGLLGFEIGLGVQFYDRLQIRLRYGPLWSVAEPDQPPDVFSRSRMRHALQGDIGYRLLLRQKPFPIYLGAFIGGSAGKNETEVTTLAGVQTDPNCTANCTVTVQRTDTEEDEWRGYPLVGVELELLGGVGLSYAFLPDVTDIEMSIHRGLLAFSL